MNTTVRNKLIVVLILSIIVLGGGGLYLRLQYTYFAKHRYQTNFLFLNGSKKSTQPKIIISQAQVPESKKSSRSRNHNENEQDIAVSMNNNSYSGIGNSGSTTYSSGFQQNFGFSNFSSKSENDRLYSGSAGGGMLFAANGGKGGSSASSTSSSFGGMGGISNPPAFVPFKDGNANNHALVDPGIEIEMKKITPVGDSLWLLLLLAFSYLGIRRFRRQ